MLRAGQSPAEPVTPSVADASAAAGPAGARLGGQVAKGNALGHTSGRAHREKYTQPHLRAYAWHMHGAGAPTGDSPP